MNHDSTLIGDQDWQVHCAYQHRNLEQLRNLTQQLPKNFSIPLFQDGNRVCWIAIAEGTQTDTGIIIGRFLAYAHHCKSWQWKYLIWLQPSRSSVVADTAWESDLELLERISHESTSVDRSGTELD